MDNAAASGEHTTDGTPHGYSSLTPFIAVSPASDAVDWYAQVFGAEIMSATEVDGQTIHAELSFDQGNLQVGEPNLTYGTGEAPADSQACYSLGLYCNNVDERMAKALDNGATLREEVSTFVSGDRFGSIVDPFGVRWNIMTRVEDLSSSESAARVAAWAAEQGKG